MDAIYIYIDESLYFEPNGQIGNLISTAGVANKMEMERLLRSDKTNNMTANTVSTSESGSKKSNFKSISKTRLNSIPSKDAWESDFALSPFIVSEQSY